MKLLLIRFCTAHLVPLLPYRTKMMLNKFLYLCQINFVIFVPKRLLYAQNLTQISLGKFLSTRGQRVRSSFQTSLIKIFTIYYANSFATYESGTLITKSLIEFKGFENDTLTRQNYRMQIWPIFAFVNSAFFSSSFFSFAIFSSP